MHTPPFEVVVVGAVGVDTSVWLPDGQVDLTHETTFLENIDSVGQAGGYSARGFAQLGRRTAFIGCVGEDHCGRFIRQEFERDGIDTSALFIDPHGTKRSVNLMLSPGRRKSFYDGKGAMHIEPNLDLCRRALHGAKLAHFNIVNWSRRLLPVAREAGAVISTDLQDITDPDDAYRHDWIEQSDILFFSTVNHGDPEPLFRALQCRSSARLMIAGMGEEGCAVCTPEGIERFGPVSLPDPVTDTTGAGDSLAVGFLTSHVLDGMPVADAILRGQIAARHACSVRSDSSRLITAERLDRIHTGLRR